MYEWGLGTGVGGWAWDGIGDQAGKVHWGQVMEHFECHASSSGHLQGLVGWRMDNWGFRGRQSGQWGHAIPQSAAPSPPSSHPAFSEYLVVGVAVVKSFAGHLDWVLALFLKFFLILTPAQSPCSALWEASNIEWEHIRLGAHLSYFTFTLYLCKHDIAVQIQPWASQKSGQVQESRAGMTALLLLAFPTPLTPPPPGLSFPFSLASQS